MFKPSTHAIPELAEGVRVCWEEDERAFVLLYPEGMIVLDRSISDLLQRCDGKLSIEEIIAQMQCDGAVRFNKQHVLQNIDQVVNYGWLRLR